MLEPITLTMSNNKPCRMVWCQREYRVMDEPTLLEMEYSRMTHPLPNPAWRFTAGADDGDTRVFDVRFDHASAQWQIVRSYV